MTATLTILKLGATYTFQYRSGASGAHLLLASEPGSDPDFPGHFLRAARRLNELMRHRATPGDFAPPQTDPLRALGRMLYQQLLPSTVQEALQRLAPGSPLQLVTNTPEIPWELLHDDGDFLALRLAVARTPVVNSLRSPQPVTTGRPFAALLIGNPTGDLPETAREIEQIAALLEAVPGAEPPRILMRRRASKATLLPELASGRYDLIHYAGHARFNPADQAASGLILAGGEILTVENVTSALSGSPFLFLNGCESVRSAADASHTEYASDAAAPDGLGSAAAGLADAFLRGGAAGVLGTLWPVHDAGSSGLALRLYRAVLSGEPIGAALRAARLAARQSNPDDPLWASLVLYGDATAALPLPRQHRRRPATVLSIHFHALDAFYASAHREATVQTMDALQSRLAATLTHYGGQICLRGADGCTAIFGLSGTQQNDAWRAVHAALAILALREDAPEAPAAPALSVGLDSGEVFVPTDLRRETDALPAAGALLYRATARARQAPPGAIHASSVLLSLVTGHVVAVPVASSNNAEQADTQPYQITGLRTAGRDRLRHQPRQSSVGRTAELAQLQRLWDECRRGRGQLVGLVGEAGIGKSHLLHMLREHLEETDGSPYDWIEIAVPSAYTPRPYELLAQLVEHLLLALTPDTAPLHTPKRDQVERALHHLPAPLPPAQQREAVALLGEVLRFATLDIALEHLDGPARQRRLVTLVGRLLTNYTGRAPIVLAVDDLHAADSVSLELLNQLVAGIDRLPLLLIAAFRTDDEWQPPWWNRRTYNPIHLHALEESASKELLHDLFQHALIDSPLDGATIPDELVELLLERSQRNPLFLRELVVSLRESGSLRVEGNRWRLHTDPGHHGVPGTVQRVLLTRIERLPPPAQQVLSVAAVLGDTVDPALLHMLLAATLDEPAMAQALSELEWREFIHPLWGAEHVIFRHGLVREVAYGRLLLDERRRHHRRTADLLAQDGDASADRAEQIAHHCFYSVTVPVGAGTWDVAPDASPGQIRRAADALIRAGEQAQAAYAAQDALHHLRRALLMATSQENAPDPLHDQLVEIYDGMAAAHQIISEFDAAIAALQRAQALVHCGVNTTADSRSAGQMVLPFEELPMYFYRDLRVESVQRQDDTGAVIQWADFARRLGLLYEWKGDPDAALAWLQRALQHLSAEKTAETAAERTLAAAIHMRLASVHFHRGDLDAASTACHTGLALLESGEDPRVQGEAHNLLGTIHAVQGENAAALDEYNRSLQIWTDLDDAYQAARVEDNLGGTYLWMGDWHAAQTHLERGYAFWHAIDDAFNRAFARLNLGLVALYRGEWAEAGERFHESLDTWSATENGRWVALCHTNLGLLAIAQANWADARSHLETALALLHAGEVRDLLPEALYAMAEVELAASQWAAAQALAQQAVTLAADLEMDIEHGVALRTLGRIHLAQGDLSAAEAALDHSLARLTDADNRYERARTLVALSWLRAEQGAGVAAEAARQEAITGLRALGAAGDLRALGVA